jgi:hypothetical protein
MVDAPVFSEGGKGTRNGPDLQFCTIIAAEIGSISRA